MCRLIIKNVGPINFVDMDVKKITMIIGPQSSGKSTIGKILCHCQWIEKRCFTNPTDEISHHKATFLAGIEDYYRMEGYFSKESYILYEGDYITLKHEDEDTDIIVTSSDDSQYLYPKLSYVPASRNFVSMIPNLKKYNDSNDLLMSFIYDWTTSRNYIKHVELGKILQRNIHFSYNKEEDKETILDGGANIKLQNASSGVQSLLPLYLVSSYLLDGIYKRIKPLTTEQKSQIDRFLADFKTVRKLNDTMKGDGKNVNSEMEESFRVAFAALTENPLFNILMDDFEGVQDSLQRKFFYKLSSLYIEEGEQNLFPEAQAKLIYWLLGYMSDAEQSHTCFLTTHSPYMLFALNNCLMGYLVAKQLPDEVASELPSRGSWIAPSKVAIYQVNDGRLVSIQDEDGLLMENYLNDAYRKNSSEYMTMLSYYDA